MAAAFDADAPEESEAPDESAGGDALGDEPLDEADDDGAADEPELDSVAAGAVELPDDMELSARAAVVVSVALVPAAPPLAAAWSSAARRSQPSANMEDSSTVNARAFEVFVLAFMHESFPDRGPKNPALPVGLTAARCACRQGAVPRYLLVSEVVAPGVLDELDELPVAPGVDGVELPEVLPDALPEADPDASLPALGVLDPLVAPEPAAPLSVAAGGVLGGALGVVAVEPAAESVAAGAAGSSPAFLQPVAATLTSAASKRTLDA